MEASCSQILLFLADLSFVQMPVTDSSDAFEECLFYKERTFFSKHKAPCISAQNRVHKPPIFENSSEVYVSDSRTEALIYSCATTGKCQSPR